MCWVLHKYSFKLYKVLKWAEFIIAGPVGKTDAPGHPVRWAPYCPGLPHKDETVFSVLKHSLLWRLEWREPL